MSIADKLITIAENEQRVFEAGKLSLLRESKYMNGSLSGEVVAANDVSAVEHDVDVHLSSDTVTDFLQVNVKRYGKNIFNADALLQATGWGFDGVYYNGSPVYLRNEFNPNTSGKYLYDAFAPDTQYTLSLKGYCNSETIVDSLSFFFHYRDGTNSRVYLSTDKTEQSVVLTSEAGKSVVGLFCSVSQVPKIYLRDIQLEVGDTATSYEPYVEPTIYTANADGTVDGVRSLSPSMTLTTDTDGVMIDCSYLRDVDRYIDGLTGGA